MTRADIKDMKNIVVLYHNDEDGFAGAWVAWKKFKNKAQYIQASYTNQTEANFNGKTVYMIDFCYNNKSKMEKILKNNKKVIVIDHHISQREPAKISSENIYSTKHSACVLAWNYFNPKKPVPKLLSYIEDMDLWKFKMRFTREIIASLDTYPLRFTVWDKIVRDFQKASKIKKYVSEGRAIVKYQDTLIESLVENGIKIKIGGHKAVSVNSPILNSEIGHFIWENYPNTVGLIWNSKNGRVKVSLRSSKNIDVSKIAQKFGGGGHKQASGFSFDGKFNFPWKPVKKKHG